MFTEPSTEEVIEVAAGLGMRLSTEEARVYRDVLVRQLRGLDAFVQSRTVPEWRPPLVHGTRAPGRRPLDEEDPLNAWLWTCDIGGAPDGLLAGKTVSYKDTISVAGVPLTFGSFMLEGLIPDVDATVVTRVLEAGGRVIGKNTCSGFTGGFGDGGSMGDYGPPMNPHSTEHAAGGSSSGSAVAVASSQVDVAFGGDQGGSIRIPSAWCGVVGLKPTFGLVSHFGVAFGSEQSVDYVGPMARTVDDVAHALQSVAGFDGLDPRQGRDVPEQVDVLGMLEEGVSGLRVGVLEEGLEGADPDVAELVLAAVDVLASAGAQVSRVSVPAHGLAARAQAALTPEGALALFHTGLFGAFAKTHYPASVIAAVDVAWKTHADHLSARAKARYLLAEFSRRNYHGRVYAKAQNVRPTIVGAYDAALEGVDVLVMPTCGMTAPRRQEDEDRLSAIERSIRSAPGRTRNTAPFNYTGHPALAVPCGKSGGLPVSMQLVGRFFEDPLLLRAAWAYQESVDWEKTTRVAA